MRDALRRLAGVSAVLAVAALAGACAPREDAEGETSPIATAATDSASLPAPTFHHLHINAVDPARSLEWWQTVWPSGEITTVAGFPAFAADGAHCRPAVHGEEHSVANSGSDRVYGQERRSSALGAVEL